MTVNQEILAKMDEAAKLAADELQEIIDNAGKEEIVGIRNVLAWFCKHKNTAGYKRLGKVIIAQE